MPLSSKIKARKLNAWSVHTPGADAIWKLSKRELIEIALHLGAMCCDAYDDALENGEAAERVLNERKALKRAGLL